MKSKKIIGGLFLILLLLVLVWFTSRMMANRLARQEYGVDPISISLMESSGGDTTSNEETTFPQNDMIPAEKEINCCEGWNLLEAVNRMTDYSIDETTGIAIRQDGFMVIPMIPVTKKGLLGIRTPDSDLKLICFDGQQNIISTHLIGATDGMVYQVAENCCYVTVCLTMEGYDSAIVIENDRNDARIVNGQKNAYSDVRKAVDSIEKSGMVMIFQGTYRGNIKCWGKEITIIGTNREECILESSSSSYYAPPIEMSAGRIENLTIRATGAYSGENAGAYAIHIEDNALYGKELIIRNCNISSTSNSGIGMGMRGGCRVTIENSTLSGHEFGLFCHDSAYAKYTGKQELILNGCRVEGQYGNYAIRFDSQGVSGATIHLTFVDNTFENANTNNTEQLLSVRNNGGMGTADNWMQLKNYYLSEQSRGNNISKMNY